MNLPSFLSNRLIDFILFQVQWFCCLLSVKSYFSYGYLIAALLWLVSLIFQKANITIILLIFILAAVGIINDSALQYFNVYKIQPLSDTAIIPPWLIILWLCFCTWYAQADWVNKKYFLFSLFGMIAGPLSYFAGAKFSALIFIRPTIYSLATISIDWLFLCLFFTYLSRNAFLSHKKQTKN